MSKYKTPSLTADIFIFDDDFNFILIKRLNDPYKDCWALPDLVNVYSNPDRDPRRHTVTVAFTAKGDLNARKADSDAKEIGVFSYDEISEMDIAFDHRQIINDCLKKVNKMSF